MNWHFVLRERMLRLHNRVCKESSWPGLSRPPRSCGTALHRYRGRRDKPGDDGGGWVDAIRKRASAGTAGVALIAAALTATTLAQAQAQSQEQQPTREQAIESLRAKQLTRCPQLDPKYGCSVAPTGRIDVEVRFAFGSAALDRTAAAKLTALGTELGKPERKGARLVVDGHTDARGGDEFNQRLSERRAAAVKHVLVEKLGMPDETVVAVGHGKAELKNAADPFAAENRRVAISAAAAPNAAGPR
jgi:outer membrane protein OmpA-like peptidoglycan-associated protein